MALQVHQLTVGPLEENCYFLVNEDRREAIVVDPGDEGAVILSHIKNLGVRVSAIWNTHAHFDHIGANAVVAAQTGAPILIHAIEAPWLESEMLCGAALFGAPFVPSKATGTWADGDQFEALGTQWIVRHAPGHSPGLCALISNDEKLVVGGDLLFKGSVGRMDLPGGSAAAMTQSLRSLFNDWSKDDFRVLPGHGPVTTIGQERKSNWLVQEALGPGLEG
ncbi:MBL fold metallo-hydrolase [bacterium]|nr:MBL fold metallo-hydrolase [bacterium]